jgi:IS5 family transposase
MCAETEINASEPTFFEVQTKSEEAPMREKAKQQPTLLAAPIDHVHAHELRRMSEVLDELDKPVSLVHADLVGRGTKKKGRKGMTSEQVLRAMLLKQTNGFSYQELAFHLADSQCYRWFCRVGLGDEAPQSVDGQLLVDRS